MHFVRTILRDSRGATALEYGFILALITLMIIAGIQGVAGATIDKWNFVADKVTKA